MMLPVSVTSTRLMRRLRNVAGSHRHHHNQRCVAWSATRKTVIRSACGISYIHFNP
jgi:hypothetical protein